MPIINSKEFKKMHGINVKSPLGLKQIAKLSGMPVEALLEVFDKGVGAYHTNPRSVRPMVKSPEQWAYARVYSFVMKRKGTFYGVDSHIAKKYGLIYS
jgi:hypothetical protein